MVARMPVIVSIGVMVRHCPDCAARYPSSHPRWRQRQLLGDEEPAEDEASNKVKERPQGMR